jgi:tetratricopeptide (TPR) repeat protein
MPKDRCGLTLSTSAEAAASYTDGIERLLRLDAGSLPHFEQAVRVDPTFALGHATVALLAAEYGDRDHAKIHLHLAERNTVRASARERSAVHALGVVCTGDGPSAFADLVRHLTDYPADALLLDVAFPTIAFSGVTETSAEVWSLVEGAAPAYGDDWFYLSLLSFVRQEQERYDEALVLADRALEIEPFSGHAVHAAAHVHYETSDYAGGLRWLDDWLTRSPATSTEFRSHASWHAALYELCIGDISAVQRRWHTQLAPPESEGLRVLVDAGSMLHRCQLRHVWEVDLPTDQLIEAASAELLRRPPSAFAALHAGLAWAVAGDADELGALIRYATGAFSCSADVLVPVLQGLLAQVEGRHSTAADLIQRALPRLDRLGGSIAQRGVVHEALLRSLVDCGRLDEARQELTRELDRGRTVHWVPRELAVPS